MDDQHLSTVSPHPGIDINTKSVTVIDIADGVIKKRRQQFKVFAVAGSFYNIVLDDIGRIKKDHSLYLLTSFRCNKR